MKVPGKQVRGVGRSPPQNTSAAAYLVVGHEFVDARLELLLAEAPEEDLHALIHINRCRLVLRMGWEQGESR